MIASVTDVSKTFKKKNQMRLQLSKLVYLNVFVRQTDYLSDCLLFCVCLVLCMYPVRQSDSQ